MSVATSHSWDGLAIRRKVWAVLLVVVIPMVAMFSLHAALLRNVLETQHLRHQAFLAREHTQVLRRLAVDIEDAFRGYLLTNEQSFLAPMREAERRLDDTLARGQELMAAFPNAPTNFTDVGVRIHGLLASKHALLDKVETGRAAEALSYVKSGQGLVLSDEIRAELRRSEDWLDRTIERLDQQALSLSTQAFWGLVGAVAIGFVLGGFGVRLLVRSVTRPLELIRSALSEFAGGGDASRADSLRMVDSSDEIGGLARSCEDMMARIDANIRELQILHDVSLQICTIRHGGTDTVVQHIADTAAAPVGADVCLILSRNEAMGCWIVEAASGDLADRLRKTVMLWEELPISIQAFESRQPAVGEELRTDTRPEMVRRNLIGNSMLAVPLLSHGVSFGVMAFLAERSIPMDAWNVRMAVSLAGAAAVAIDNARMYEAAYERQQRTRARLRTLEHLGESLAHDLKGPAERMAGLGGLLRNELETPLTERVAKLLELIEENGAEVAHRVEQVLSLAEVGGRHEVLQAVDPNMVLDDILKSRASELERAGVTFARMPGLPCVACHRAYLYQILDNLISNAVKFSVGYASPKIVVSAEQVDNRAVFSVADNGPGIPAQHRERVFDPFVRLYPRTCEGTGIGLAIVRRIVELYEGRVWIDEGDTGGCRVRFSLPLLASFPPAGGGGGTPTIR